MRDVAQSAGVSSSTVSLTFNTPNRVSSATAKKIWEAAERLGYKPNVLAQSFKRGRSDLIGVVLGDLSIAFCSVLVKHIERYAKEAGFNVMIAQSAQDQDEEIQILEHFSSMKVAGAVLFPHGKGPEYIEALARFEPPIVGIDQRVEGAHFDLARSDNRLASSILTEHVLRLGHRRITHMAGPSNIWNANERAESFKERMQAASIDTFDIVEAGYELEPAYRRAMEVLTRSDPPTAILAANSNMGLGCLMAMQDLGFKCPDDVSLATIGNIPWAEVIQPRLTYIEQDLELMAKEAMAFLLDRIHATENDMIAQREFVLPPQFKLGQSTRRL